APRRAVPVERIALQLAGVRLVVADLDARDLPQGGEQRQRKARVLVPQDADRPWPGHALPRLGEAVHRDDHRRLAGLKPGLDGAIDGAMIGLVEAVDAKGNLVL